MKKMKWEVTIAEVENGYVVRVGCKLFVCQDWDFLVRELSAYAAGKKTQFAEEVMKGMPTPNEECTPEQPTLGSSREMTESLARG